MPDRLSNLPSGTVATIVSLPDGMPALSRLRELGVLPGTRLQVIRRAPLGDPIEISLRGALLSLRQSEAALIEVSPATGG